MKDLKKTGGSDKQTTRAGANEDSLMRNRKFGALGKSKAPAKTKSEIKSLSSSFRSYWSLKKIRMGYDEVCSTVSSEYNFIEKNGFGCLFASTHNRGIYYPREDSKSVTDHWSFTKFDRVSDFDYQSARERERAVFHEKYNEQMKCLVAGVLFKTGSPKVVKPSTYGKYATFKKVVAKEVPKISEREMQIIKYEQKYNLRGLGTLKFRELKINTHSESRENTWWARIKDADRVGYLENIKEEIENVIKDGLWSSNSRLDSFLEYINDKISRLHSFYKKEIPII